MPIRLLTSGGGTTTIQPTTSASSVTLTVPSVNANVVTTGDTASVTQAMLGSGLAGTGPAFSAYASVATSLTSGAFTKIALQTEEYDTASCFDSTTNYRFTPNVAGYYQFSAAFQVASPKILVASLFKNGSEYRRCVYTDPNTIYAVGANALIYLNGSTDYVELHGYNGTAGAVNTQTGIQFTWMTGFLARAA